MKSKLMVKMMIFGFALIIGFTLGLSNADAVAVPVNIDIKPMSCPNPLNVKAKGVVPVAILGTKDFDVTQIDPGTILLDGGLGVAPLRWDWEDVATPYNGVSIVDSLDCTEDGPDGYLDLVLMFNVQDLVAALGDIDLVLSLTGNLLDGTPIMGVDVVVIFKKGMG